LVCGRVWVWCCIYIGRERGKAPGIHGSIRKRRGLSEQHMRGISIMFSTDVVVCLLGVCLVWWLVVVAAFGFWCCTVHLQRKRRLGFITIYARGGDHQSSTAHAWCLHNFLNKKHWRRCCSAVCLARGFLVSCSVLVLDIHQQ